MGLGIDVDGWRGFGEDELIWNRITHDSHNCTPTQKFESRSNKFVEWWEEDNIELTDVLEILKAPFQDDERSYATGAVLH